MAVDRASDELNIDFNKLKQFLKKLFAEPGDAEVNTTPALNLSKVKAFFKNSFNKVKSSHHSVDEENLNINWNKLREFILSYKVFLLLLIPMTLSVYLRVQPLFLPVTDDWARETVYNSIRFNLAAQVESQYPNLRDDQKQELVNNQFSDLLASNKKALEEQIKYQSDYFKSRLQDSSGHTYLAEIDPYYYARQVKNLIEKGNIGDELRNGRPYNNHQLAPIGKFSEANLHMWVEAYIYKFVRLFNPNTDLLHVIFYVPVILATISTLPAFFIGRRLGGDIGGLFASVLIVVHPAFLNRTFGGFSDTDSYNILIPLMAVWLFFMALEARKSYLQMVYISLTGLLLGVYASFWTGWWFILNFILAGLGLSFVAMLLLTLLKRQRVDIKALSMSYLLPMAVMLASTTISLSIIAWMLYRSSFVKSVQYLSAIFFSLPLKIVHLKSVGVAKLWPNVLTTVAELNPGSAREVMAILGGKLLFYLAILGLVLLLFRTKDWKSNLKYTLFVLVWAVGTFYATTKGIRFTLLLIPPFAFALAVVVGFLYNNLSKKISGALSVNSSLCRVIFIVLFFLFFVVDVPHVYSAPFKSSLNSAGVLIPSIEDAWWETLAAIKELTGKRAIISSWWDFGHWFAYIADRPVTFDGASQDTPQAHWIGRFFLTANEDEAVGILRMLDCDGNRAFDKLYNLTNDTIESLDILRQAILMNRDDAEKFYNHFFKELESISVLDSSHCLNPPEAIVIASEDMVQKSGVWAHFGGWNFTRAAMVNKAQQGKEDFAKFAVARLNLSDPAEIEKTFSYVKNLGTGSDANNWISPWPSYASQKPVACLNQTLQVICADGLVLNKTNFNAEVYQQNNLAGAPYSLVYVNPAGDVVELLYPRTSKANVDLSFMLIPEGSGFISQVALPPLGPSMFSKLFYFEAAGLKHFKKISDRTTVFGQRIIAYKVDWNPEPAAD